MNELRELGWSFGDDRYDALLVQTCLVREMINLEYLQETHGAPVVLLDDSASSGSHKFRFLSGGSAWLRGYIKKQLLRDTEAYKFVYPHKRYHYYKLAELNSALEGTTRPDGRITDKVLSKIKLGWNLGLAEREGLSPEGPFPTNERPIDIHFSIKVRHVGKKKRERLGKEEAHYTWHRDTCYKEVERIAKRWGYSLSGRLRGKPYLNAMRRAKVCISPLGLGEICWRDFEAIANGALLLKPNMEHITTWPNIYQPLQTYVPIRWDWADLDEMLGKIFHDYKQWDTVRRNAYGVLQKAWSNKVFANRFNNVMSQFRL